MLRSAHLESMIEVKSKELIKKLENGEKEKA